MRLFLAVISQITSKQQICIDFLRVVLHSAMICMIYRILYNLHAVKARGVCVSANRAGEGLSKGPCCQGQRRF